MTRRLLVHVFVLTALVTALDCIKPVHIDDAIYLDYAAQIARRPTDPYGFDVFWRQWPEPARWELCPPVLPYWLAIGVRVVGVGHPALLKLWMAAFVATFAFATAWLLRRFTRAGEDDADDDRLAIVLLWATMLSPAVLPGVNLMLDVPAVALALAGVACFVSAVDTSSMRRAIIAGALAGLAGQTKYTTLLTPLILIAYAIAHRRIALGLLAAACAGLIFAAIEAPILLRYGDGGHFLLQLRLDRADLGRGRIPKLTLLRNLPPYVGGLAPQLAVLAWAAACRALTPRRVIATATIIVLAAAVGTVLALSGAVAPIAAAFDAVTLVIVVALMWACWTDRRTAPASTPPRDRRDLAFLIAWVLLELIATIAVSPYAAARRVIGLIIAITILTARLLSKARALPVPAQATWIAAALAIVTGLGYYAIDFDRASVTQQLAQDAHDDIARQSPSAGATVWYTGHWSFQYYAGQLGMKPLVPGTSQLAAGDWLVVPMDVDAQSIAFSSRQLRVVTMLAKSPQLPWLTTVPGYYLGDSPLEIARVPTSRVMVAQVIQPFVPQTDWDAAVFVTWMRRRIDVGHLPDAALTELQRCAADEQRPGVAKACRRLLEIYHQTTAAAVKLPPPK